VRTRMFVVDIAANGDGVARVHGEVFADVRPASSLIGIAGLVDPRMLVEVEVDAFRGEWA
jgi:enamine deaminase RidA (YjgF/YER057c/UK114 family)